MASLFIRNLTVYPLELIRVQRFECDKIKQGSFFNNVTSTVTGLLQATDTKKYEIRPRGDPIGNHDVSFQVEPFRTAETNVRSPDQGIEVVRLTFTIDDHRYATDIPSLTTKSAVMDKLDHAPLHLTALYLPGSALVAVISSMRLNAWMHELQDEWPLTMLSIPGTHNSPTCHTALPSVRCQAADVPAQLQNGVRFLDVRVSANKDDHVLTLVHSAFPISLFDKKYFADMLEHVYAFLEQNPSETVIMSVKREGTGKATDGEMAHHLKHSYLDKQSHRWWTHPRVPTLGEARGKIVLVRRFGLNDDMSDDGGYGLDAQEWPDNCQDGCGGGGGGFRIQDFYEISESQNIETKIEFGRGQLERAAEQDFAHTGMPDHNPDAPIPPFFINFLSASNFFNATCWPERIAQKVNPAIMEYLCGRHGEEGKGPLQLKVGCAGTGVVVTDWIGAQDDWDLVKCIVGMNVGLQLRKWS